jgi:hypothetical protein
MTRLSERCLGILECPKVRAGAAARRRASVLVVRLPAGLVEQPEHDASLVRTGLSAARPYGWTGLSVG